MCVGAEPGGAGPGLEQGAPEPRAEPAGRCSLAGADALPREAQRGQEQAPCWAVWDA